jgi:hypothetical protein
MMQQEKIVAPFGLGDFGSGPPSRLNTMLAILNVQSRLYAALLLTRRAFSAILSKIESCHLVKVSGYVPYAIESASVTVMCLSPGTTRPPEVTTATRA